MSPDADLTPEIPVQLTSGADLVLALDGFEGPIDLLLTLAREQKLDLSTIAILPLAEQYLAYIESAHKLRLEIAADYLVMAAWLAYLKSRLLLPEPEAAAEGEVDPAAMAEALKFQLQRLEAMQKAAKRLEERPRLGLDVFLRGKPEPVEIEEKPIWFLPIQDLITALAAPARRRKPDSYAIAPTRLYSMEETVERMRDLHRVMPSWTVLQTYMPKPGHEAPTLEMVKNGEMDVRQDGTFAPIYIRRRETTGEITDE